MKIKTIFSMIILAVVGVIALTLFEIKTVKGNELGVMETWSDGVETNVFAPKTYFLFPGYSKEMYTYNRGVQTFHHANYVVKSSDNQEMHISSVVQWHINPVKLVEYHKLVKDKAEDKALTPALLRIVKLHATTFKALEAYSGEGLIKMQTAIEKDLRADNELDKLGIAIDTYQIQENDLEPKYIEEIKGRQLAQIRQQRAAEEQKAADADALVAKAKAQAEFNTVIVRAQQEKEQKVLQAEAMNEQTILQAKAENEKSILAAQAEQKKLTLESEGKMQAALNEAKGLLELGKSKAEAQRLQLQAYSVPGSDLYAKVEIAKQLGVAFQNVKGFLPSDLKFSIIANDYNKAVDAVTGNALVPVK